MNSKDELKILYKEKVNLILHEILNHFKTISGHIIVSFLQSFIYFMATSGLIKNSVLEMKRFPLFPMGFGLSSQETFCETKTGKQFITKSQRFIYRPMEQILFSVKSVGQTPIYSVVLCLQIPTCLCILIYTSRQTLITVSACIQMLFILYPQESELTEQDWN